MVKGMEKGREGKKRDGKRELNKERKIYGERESKKGKGIRKGKGREMGKGWDGRRKGIRERERFDI